MCTHYKDVLVENLLVNKVKYILSERFWVAVLLVHVGTLYIMYSSGWGAGGVHVDLHHKNKGMGGGEYCI